MNLYSFLAALGWCGVACFAIWRAATLLARFLALREVNEAHLASAQAEQFRLVAEKEANRTNEERARIDSAERIAQLRASTDQQERERKRATKDIQLPDDLEAYVNAWNDQWARDDQRDFVRVKFLELHTGDSPATWQRVRRAVGIGELPE